MDKRKNLLVLNYSKILDINYQEDVEFFHSDLKHNHIEIDCYGNTSVPGIFAAGDCASGHEYQFVIAGGQGCMAFIKAMRYLAKQKR